MWNSAKEFREDLFKSYQSSRLQRAKELVPLGKTLIGNAARLKKPKPPKRVVSALKLIFYSTNIQAIERA